MQFARDAEGKLMLRKQRPSRLEVWLQVMLTAVLLVCFSELILTPGFLSLRPAASRVQATAPMGNR